MNPNAYATEFLASHRAAQLDRENELIRRHAERRAETGAPARRARFAAVMAWLPRAKRTAPAQLTRVAAH